MALKTWIFVGACSTRALHSQLRRWLRFHTRIAAPPIIESMIWSAREQNQQEPTWKSGDARLRGTMETKGNKKIAVIVAVTSDTQFNDFILASPGLQEINAEIISVHGAKSAAE